MVAVEVFSGELHDDKTLPSQIERLKTRFCLRRVVLVSDRGMVTKANLELMRSSAGVEWITALKAPQIKALVASGALQLSLFDERDLAEITSPDYPGERLVVCRNPLIAAERARKRSSCSSYSARPPGDPTARRARHPPGRRPDRPRCRPRPQALPDAQAFQIEISDTTFTFARKQAQIAAEAALDGLDVLRTSTQAQRLPTAEVVRSDKGLDRSSAPSPPSKAPSSDPPDPPPPRPPSPRPRPALHARLLPHLAPTRGLDADAVQRRQPPIAANPVAKAHAQPKPTKSPDQRTTTGEPCPATKPPHRLAPSPAHDPPRRRPRDLRRRPQPTPLQARASTRPPSTGHRVVTTRQPHQHANRDPHSRCGEAGRAGLTRRRPGAGPGSRQRSPRPAGRGGHPQARGTSRRAPPP